MKNMRILICSGLLVLIITLSGITICYYMIKNQNTENTDSDDIVEVVYRNVYNVSSNPGVKTINSYSEFQSLIERDTNTFMVLGKSGCVYCEKYLPVLKRVSEAYNIEVIYVDMLSLSSEDYHSILNSSLVVPSKCTSSGLDAPLSAGIGTPLTLFINNGSVYDCIRGYKDESNLVISLKLIGFLS